MLQGWAQCCKWVPSNLHMVNAAKATDMRRRHCRKSLDVQHIHCAVACRSAARSTSHPLHALLVHRWIW